MSGRGMLRSAGTGRMFHVQPREWLMLVLLIAIPLAIAVVVTLWSIKQMAYAPKKPGRPKPVLSAEDLAKLANDPGTAAASVARVPEDSPPLERDGPRAGREAATLGAGAQGPAPTSDGSVPGSV